MFDQQSILDLFRRQWSSVRKSDIDWIFNNNGGISALESVLFYLHILDTSPEHVIEFSPNHGYSTFAIASALRVVERPGCFATFDIQQRFCDATGRLMLEHGLTDFVHIVCGDALKEIPAHIQREEVQVEFCFVDSDHGAEFAQRYIDELFPLFTSSCIIGVHDIASHGRNNDGKSAFKTSLQGGQHPGGEEGPVRKFIEGGKLDYSVLHAVTGGKHEGANLDYNDELYDQIVDIGGYDFRQSKSPPCPKTLLFRK